MYLAALARAEDCPISIQPGGRLELHPRYTPSAELDLSFHRDQRLVVGCLGWAIPLQLDDRRRAAFATWPSFWANGGAN